MTNFTKIKTKFVCETLAKTDNQDYIEDLMFIERWLSGESHGMGSAYRAHSFEEKYKEEYVAIWKELNLKGYENYLKRMQEEKKEDEKIDKKNKEEEYRNAEESERTWKEMKEKYKN